MQFIVDKFNRCNLIYWSDIVNIMSKLITVLFEVFELHALERVALCWNMFHCNMVQKALVPATLKQRFGWDPPWLLDLEWMLALLFLLNLGYIHSPDMKCVPSWRHHHGQYLPINRIDGSRDCTIFIQPCHKILCKVKPCDWDTLDFLIIFSMHFCRWEWISTLCSIQYMCKDLV